MWWGEEEERFQLSRSIRRLPGQLPGAWRTMPSMILLLVVYEIQIEFKGVGVVPGSVLAL